MGWKTQDDEKPGGGTVNDANVHARNTTLPSGTKLPEKDSPANSCRLILERGGGVSRLN